MTDMPAHDAAGVDRKLPPAKTTPLWAAERSAKLKRCERRLLDGLLGEEDVFAVQTTGTKIDVGKWYRRQRVCVCVLPDELLLFAAGPRPLTERIALADLHDSRYNHVTGEVVLAPADGLGVDRLKVPPLEGLELLAQIYKVENDHA